MVWMKPATLLLPLPLAAAALLAAEPDPEARALLARWAERTRDVRTLQLELVQTKTMKLLRRPLVSKGTLLLKGERLRLDLAGADGERDLVLQVLPGEVRIWHPQLQRQEVWAVREGRLPPESPFLMLGPDVEKLPERYDVRREAIEGGDALVLEPREASQVAWMRLEFKQGELVATEQQDKRGTNIRTEIARWVQNPEVSDAALELELPAGATVVRMDEKDRGGAR